MQIKISARHCHLSEASQQFIRDKAQNLLHFFERLMMIEVTVDLDAKNQIYRTEITASAEHKHDFVASESNADLAASVDAVVKKLELQVRKYKEKVQDHRRAPSASDVAGAPNVETSTEE